MSYYNLFNTVQPTIDNPTVEEMQAYISKWGDPFDYSKSVEEKYYELVEKNKNKQVDNNTGTKNQPPKDREEGTNFWQQMWNNPYATRGVHMTMEQRLQALGAAVSGKNKLGIVGGAGAVALGGARNLMTGYAFGKEYDRVRTDSIKREKERRAGNYEYAIGRDGGEIKIFKDGGMLDLSPEKIATNEYIASLPKQMQHLANAEIEEDEYVIKPNDSNIQKVKGNTHEKGGVKQFLPDGTRIVSNHLKVGGRFANLIKDKLDLKVKPTDTYAKVIDKYSEKIGLTKLTNEYEDLQKAILSNEKIEDEQTKNINGNFLKKKQQELDSKRAPLLDNRLKFAENLVYEAQEISKIESNGDKPPIYRVGGEHIDPNIAAIFKKNGLSVKQGVAILKHFQEGGEQQMQEEQMMQQMEQGQIPQEGGGEEIIMINPQNGDVAKATTQEEYEQLAAMGYITEQEYAQAMEQQQIMQQQQKMQQQMMEKGGEMSYYRDGGKEEIEKLLKNWKTDPDYEYKFDEGTVSQMKDRLKEALNNWGIEYTEEDFAKVKTKEGMNALAKKMQDKVDPEIVQDFGLKIAPTKEGLKMLASLSDAELEKIIPDESLRKKIKSAKSGSFKTLTEDERVTLTKSLKENKDKVPKEYADKNFRDGQWFFRYPAVKEVTFENKEEYDAYIKENKGKSVKDGVYATDKDGLYIKPILKTDGETTTTDGETTTTDGETTTTTDGETTTTDGETTTTEPLKKLKIDHNLKKKGLYTAPLPLQMPPTPPQAHSMARYTLEESLDPLAISHEPVQKGILNSVDVAMESVKGVPLFQKLAMASNFGGDASQKISDAVGKVEVYNAQNAQQVEEKNAAKSDYTERARAMEIPRYERLALTAQGKTQNDIANYFNTQQSNTLKREQYLNNANLLDSLFERAYYDPKTGRIEVDGNVEFTV